MKKPPRTIRTTRLRIHLVGPDIRIKQKLAIALCKELRVKKIGRATIVPDMQISTEKRMELESRNHVYYLALENDYLCYQSNIGTKTHHLIFIDSLVDRYARSKVASSIDMDLHFGPQFSLAREGHIFLYGPTFDTRRSSILSYYDLPMQLWTNTQKETLDSLVEATRMRLGANSARLRR